MKKRNVLLLIIIMSFFLCVPLVKASEVLTVTASESADGVITVSGTVEDSMVAAAINVYDVTGEKLITMETTQINDDNTFNATISLKAGTYLMKVADYNGGTYKTLTVSPNSSSVTTNAKTPATGDNVLIYLLLSIVSIIGLSSIVVYFKRTKKVSD